MMSLQSGSNLNYISFATFSLSFKLVLCFSPLCFQGGHSQVERIIFANLTLFKLTISTFCDGTLLLTNQEKIVIHDKLSCFEDEKINMAHLNISVENRNSVSTDENFGDFPCSGTDVHLKIKTLSTERITI